MGEREAVGVVSKLDALVRRLMLRYPLLFTTRWDVLRHLYLVTGNGYEWSNGELVDVFAHLSPYPGDEACRAAFFNDLDKLRDDFADLPPLPAAEDRDTIRRARRQFQLDHLDLLVHERVSMSSREFNLTDLRSISTDYAYAFNVPDDAEESFRAGAVEVLDVAIQGLYYAEMCGEDRGLRAVAAREKERLAPVDHAAMQELIDYLLNNREA